MFGLGGLADGADDDGVDQFIFEDEEDDLIGDDIASDEDLQLKDLRAAPKASAARPMNSEDAQSESGRSAASRASIGSHFKTVATDVEILKGCLGPLRHLADSCCCHF